MALKEYVEAILPHDLIAAEAALGAAKADMAKARDQLRDRLNENVEKITAQLEEKKARFRSEQAESPEEGP